MLKDDILRLITANGAETLPSQLDEPLYVTAVRHTLECWQRGEPPPTSVHDCYRAVRLIDQAYDIARPLDG